MKQISAIQETIWLTQSIYKHSTLYNVGGYALLTGNVNACNLVEAIKEVLSKVDAVKIGYSAFNDQPYDHNPKFNDLDIAITDFSDQDDADGCCVDWMNKDMGVAFDPARNMLKVRVLKSAENRFFWYVKVHHLIFDGFSMALFFNHVLNIYKAGISTNQPAGQQELYLYAEYIKDEKSYKLSDEYLKDRDFWKNRLKSISFEKAFNSCQITSSKDSLNAKRNDLIIPRSLYNRINDFCKEENCTVFHYFVAVLFILNKCYSNETPVIGIPVFNRRSKKFKNTLGTFVNVLPFSIEINYKSTFLEVVHQVKNELKECYKHQRYPLIDILKDLDKSGNAYHVYFSYQKNDYVNHTDPFESTITFMNNGEQQEDLVFHLLEYSDTEDLILSVDYKEDVFHANVINGLIIHFNNLLNFCCNASTLLISELPYLSASERERLIFGFNPSFAERAPGGTVVELLSSQALLTPDAVALQFSGVELSYAELHGWSNRLGHYLRAVHGIGPGELVGLKLERSEWLVIGLLGILKSAGAYVPLDPAYPGDRIAYMVSDSNCRLVLDADELERFISVSDVYSTESPEILNSPSDLAYVIYTSGSTGRPKGVMIEHGNVSAFMHWCGEEFSGSSYDVVFGATSICFDLSVFEILYTLVSGKRLRLLRDGLSIAEYVTGEDHILLNTVPSVVGSLLNEGVDLSRVTVLNMAGEPVPLSYLSRLDYRGTEIRNLYGPTEDTTYSTVYRISSDEEILIGRPITGTQVYILGDHGQLQPVGVRGEICIGGAGLSRGYLNNAALSSERFVAHPFFENERIYLTGDLGRWRADGELEYLGRKDDQVKIRGFRIEPGEISAALEGYEGVLSAVVVARTVRTSEKELVAYVSGTRIFEVPELRSYLSGLLPSHQVPAYYVQLESLPLTSNGKIDKLSLPLPSEGELGSGNGYVSPRTLTEAQLVGIWEEVLGREHIGVRDSFFDLGGHSLKAVRLIGRVHKVFCVRIALKDIFSRPLLESMASLIDGSASSGYLGIPPAGYRSRYPLSSSQRRMWVLGQMEPGLTAYNIPGVFVVEGVLDPAVLEHSFGLLIKRHESLRTVFIVDESGIPFQEILSPDAVSFVMSHHDLRGEEDQDGKASALVRESSLFRFDLSSGPLLTCGLIRLQDEEWILTFTIHHIISDGWSMDVLVRELLMFYNEGGIDTLPALEIQYKDYAVWQQEQLELSSGGVMRSSGDYWLEQLSGVLPVLDLPSDKVRPLVKTYNGSVLDHLIGSELTGSFKALLSGHGASLFVGLLSSVAAILHRYSGQEDMIIGSPVAGREHSDFEGQIGLYVNTLALRVRPSGSWGYDALLDHVKTQVLDAYPHQSYPFDALVDALELPLDLGRSALFDVMVLLEEQESRVSGLALGGAVLRDYPGERARQSKFDLTFSFLDQGDHLRLSIEYNTDIYSRAGIVQLADHFERLLGAMVGDEGAPLGLLDYLSAPERERLIFGFNPSFAERAPGGTVVELLSSQALLTPDAVALQFSGVELSYAELHGWSNRLGHYLRAVHGIGPGELVGLKLERSEWLVIGLLGILKSAGAYVPLDPAYPGDRIAYMVSDSNCRLVLDADELERFISVSDVYSTESPEILNSPSDLAYVIYTSGSTGRPKGVMIEHGNLFNYIKWADNYYFKDKTRGNFGLYTSLSFDLTVTSIFCPLTLGKKIFIYSQQDDVIAILLHSFKECSIDCIKITPAHITILEYLNISSASITCAIVGGEELTQKHINILKKINPEIEIYNEYGPTEATVGCVIEKIEQNKPILIGRPITGTQVYILGDHGQLQPVGVRGEICIGGAGLSRGYLNNAALSSERFVAHPFFEGERIYLTGDLGRWRGDGELEYLGRKDDQVKIRGFRIEPGEISAALEGYEGVLSAVVVARTVRTSEKELVAYVSGTRNFEVPELRSYLNGLLPSHQVPAYYVQLESLPLTSNGKIDKLSLPLPSEGELGSGNGYVSPRTLTEAQLVGIWEEVLGREHIGVRDSFFDLGGHSLKAVRLIGRVHKVFGVRIALKDIFSRPLLESMASLIDGSASSGYLGIPPAGYRSRYPLSSSQRRMWVLGQMEPGLTAYNIPGVFVVEGVLDPAVLEHSFGLLIKRHESLRTVFIVDESGIPFQEILSPDAVSFVMSHHDLRGEEDQDGKASALVRESSLFRFDLSSGPLLTCGLIRLQDEEWILTFTIHHIISDGWSMDVLVRELLMFYNEGGIDTLPALEIQYKDYAVWQQEQLELSSGGVMRSSGDYWLEQLSGVLPVLDLPSDKVRPLVKTYNGSVLDHLIGSELTGSFKALLSGHGASLFVGLLSSVAAILHRYSGQEDMIIGSPVAGREHSDFEGQIGLYVNTLALRVRPSGSWGYDALLDHVKTQVLDAYPHQSYPFDALVDALELPLDLGRSALFDVMVLLEEQESRVSGLALGGAVLRDYPGERARQSKFDLTFSFLDQGDHLRLSIEYNTDIYSRAGIVQLADHFERLLGAMVGDEGAPLGLLDYLSAPERERLIFGFNPSFAERAPGGTVVELLSSQALLTPDAVALQFSGVELSYAELHGWSNRLGHYLRAVHGIGPGELVGLKLERSEWLVIGLLGILKSAGAYVPLDPAYPGDRIAYMVSDSNCRLVLDADELERFISVSDVYSTESPEILNSPSDLAYVIYTSGSTGRPKGVMIEHGNVSAFMHWCGEEFSGSSYDVVFGATSICFDLSVFEILYTLVSGKRLRLLRDGLSIAEYVTGEDHILLNTVPSVVGSLLNEGVDLSRVTVLNMAGEPVPLSYLSRLDYRGTEIRNLYGPTEDTTYSTVYRISSDEEILIGRPITGTQVYILGDHGQLQPVGVRGEICIGGAGLSRGYLNNAALSSERFVAHPFFENERIYLTGDLGRWRADGELEYLGRKDDQVKIRGFRIEPGEISAALEGYEGVLSAVVVARTVRTSEKELVAYVSGTRIFEVPELRSYLSGLLPSHQVPAYYVQLESLPLTSNGKIDKLSLPLPSEGELGSGNGYVSPRTLTEAQLVGIWEEVLGREHIGVRDSFFDLGGHSLKAVRLIGRVHKVFCVRIALKDIFSRPLLESMASLIDGSASSGYLGIPPAGYRSRYPLSSSQRRMWVLGQMEPGLTAYNIPGVFVVEGVLDPAVLEHSFGLLIKRHESLRTVFIVDESGIPFQEILSPDAVSFVMSHHDLRGEEDQDGKASALVRESSLFRFDLSSGPLLTCGLIRLQDEEWILTFTIHHIISDGWSMDVLVRELLMFYNEGGIDTLPALEIQYKDYAVWQQEQLELSSGGVMRSSGDYWLEQLSGVLPVLDLPSDKVRPLVKTYNGSVLDHLIGSELTGSFKALLSGHGASLFVGLLSSVAAILHRYSGQEDMIIGSPVAGREHSDFEGQIGLYVNTLALRVRPSGSWGYDALLDHVKTQVLDAYPHQSYPFDALVDALELPLDLGRSALFDVMVLLEEQESRVSGLALGGAVLRDYPGERARQSKFDLTFSFLDQGDHLRLSIEYNTDIYSRAGIVQLADHFERLLGAMVGDEGAPLGLLDYLSAPERERLIFGFNPSFAERAPGGTVVELLSSQALLTPDAVALQFSGVELSYAELHGWSNRLGHYLRAVHGIGPGELVGLKLERSEWLVIGLLGILKSAGAYVPLDPAYPGDRIAYMVSDSNCRLVLDADELERFISVSDVYSTESPEILNSPSDLAYVIYTSGSTGRPKGVMIEHGNVSAFMHWCGEEFSGSSYDVVFGATSICFDLSVFEILYTLVSGKRLRLLRDGLSIAEYVTGEDHILLNTVPSVVGSLLNEGVDLSRVTVLNMAGEPVPLSYLSRLDYRGTEIRNLYGPTEDTTYSTVYRISSDEEILIGRPITGTQVYILGDHGQLQPVGVRGEICIGGAGLSRGYLNNAALSSERFVAHPFFEGERIYLTGDLGRWRADGELEYLGRKDDQVKIRGFRIEPGEISAALEGYEGVLSAVVVARTVRTSEKELVAYVSGTRNFEVPELRSYLSGLLPSHQVPAYYVQLESLPLTSNGKIDKLSLPLPSEGELGAGNGYVSPRTLTEAQLVGIWEEVLGREHIGVRDSFFDLGGHSLKAVQLISRINNTFLVHFNIQSIFQEPTIEHIAERIVFILDQQKQKENKGNLIKIEM
ncbi:amino acid adenylation domain-containing protein [Pedobacter sp. KACC 23697]|uniref:Amino acid adenylation domain-containing protein n=1 Tax=Pedobacter sp. KACC 23697 TaxID=3149230 RepID=A0AAU7K9N5_9SPHI